MFIGDKEMPRTKPPPPKRPWDVLVPKVLVTKQYRRKEIAVSWGGGGGCHDKETLFQRHYFLRLQQQFPKKWGTCPPAPPVPTAVQNRFASLL